MRCAMRRGYWESYHMRRSLVAMVIGLLAAANASAQGPNGALPVGPMPGGVGQQPTGYGEPMPMYQPNYPRYTTMPNAMPQPAAANCGPPVLSGKDPNAFDDRCITGSGEGWTIGIGGIFLQRERLGGGVLVTQDPLGGLAGPPVMTFNDIDPDYYGGLRYSVGYRFETSAVELCGYYIFENSSSASVTNIGSLNLPFAAFAVPAGFAGIWTQADRVEQTITTRMLNTELNFRRGNGVGGELITGLRYLNLAEIYSVFTDDDSLIAGAPVPAGQATYSVRSQNHILAPQLGFEIERLVNEWAALGFFAKGAWGVNFNEVTGRLERGDGLVAPVSTRNRAQFSHFYEAGAFLNFLPWERVRFRAGYQLLWLANVPEAAANVNFNLATTLIGDNSAGDIFYHGALFELNVAF